MADNNTYYVDTESIIVAEVANIGKTYDTSYMLLLNDRITMDLQNKKDLDERLRITKAIKDSFIQFIDHVIEDKETGMNKFYCLVVGGRDFNDYDLMKKELDTYLSEYDKDNIVIVSGGAKGADSLAEAYAKENGYPLRVFHAEWEKHGKKAGFIRNEAMHKFISQYDKRGVVAFWDGQSKGTSHNFSLGKTYNNSVKIVHYNIDK